MIARWTPVPQILTIFILTVFIHEYRAVRIINYSSEVDRNIDSIVIERFESESCEGEESVSFKGFKLTEVPATAIKSSTIKNIDLQKNELNRIPIDIFDNVPSLECLNVGMNKIPYTEIFNFGHTHLKTLIVDYQSDVDEFKMLQLNMLDYPNAHFPKLEMLHVNGFNKFVLDRFPKNIFPQLTTLYLTENEFRYIDKDFVSKLPASLQHLHLERNSIYYFDVFSVGNLISLYLDGNPIQKIDVHSNYTNLKILSLQNCQLTNRLELLQLALNDLATLDLSENRLKHVPEYLFDNAKNLQNLLLRNNLLTEIPHINNLRRLNMLSLSYNRINFVTNLISNTLTVLNLQNNNISKITDSSFNDVPVLQELDLSHNKLKYLDLEWANGLKNLKHLNLRFNKFATIADMSLTSLVDLKNLYIKGNLFLEIDEYEIQLIPDTCTTYVT